jgi:hypothetical protein
MLSNWGPEQQSWRVPIRGADLAIADNACRENFPCRSGIRLFFWVLGGGMVPLATFTSSEETP